jgi:hypothetical protein
MSLPPVVDVVRNHSSVVYVCGAAAAVAVAPETPETPPNVVAVSGLPEIAPAVPRVKLPSVRFAPLAQS